MKVKHGVLDPPPVYPPDADAPDRLKIWMGAHRHKCASVGRAIGVDHSTVFRWIDRRTVPALSHRILIEQLTRGDVKREQWTR